MWGKKVTEEKIKRAIKNAKDGLEKYKNIMKLFSKVNVSESKEFQSIYTGFYRVRHNNPDFYNDYYSFMEEHRNNIPSFKDTLTYLYKFGRLESSFASKLLATIDPELPVWDQFILRHFGLEQPSTDMIKEARIIQANNVYEEIKQKYKEFLKTNESRCWIKLFDEYYPETNLTSIKKIDLILWQMRA